MPRVRFAPPASGFQDIGNARTYLLNGRQPRSTGVWMRLRIDATGVGPGAFHLFPFIGPKKSI